MFAQFYNRPFAPTGEETNFIRDINKQNIFETRPEAAADGKCKIAFVDRTVNRDNPEDSVERNVPFFLED